MTASLTAPQGFGVMTCGSLEIREGTKRRGKRMTIARGSKADIAALHGLYFLATGVWPLLSRRSFERVTGPKADFWLAQTVGILVAGVGSTILQAKRRGRI